MENIITIFSGSLPLLLNFTSKMARAVVYALLASAFILFMLLSPIKHHSSSHTHLGLSRRIGFNFPIHNFDPNFDPLMVKIRRFAEERGLTKEGNLTNLGKNPYGVEMEDENEYFVDEGKLNITLRLLLLFPLLDKSPKDGIVTFEELEAWNTKAALDRLTYRTEKELKLRDKDGDGAISFSEYLPQFSDEDIEKNAMEHGEVGWWKERFRNADVDENWVLDLEEFKNFLHPEDSSNREVQTWVLREKMKRMDDDHDGKLEFSEFTKYAYETYKSYADFEITGVCGPKEKFDELDLSNDRVLVADELIPLIHYLKPGELSYAKSYTTYLILERR